MRLHNLRCVSLRRTPTHTLSLPPPVSASQGHGLSQGLDGLRSHVNRFDDLVRDTVAYYRDVAAREREDPGSNGTRRQVVLIGMSMGGCVAAMAAEVLGDELDACVLCAPMLSVERIKKECKNCILLPLVGCFR